MAAPPLGTTARVLIALAATGFGGILGGIAAFRLARPPRDAAAPARTVAAAKPADREPEHFRVVQSINATLATEFPKQYFIIPFDLTSFTSWAMGRQPTEELVAEFLGHITEPKTTLH